jgi:serine phosphatase RsbU (regulator of sigma subunit)
VLNLPGNLREALLGLVYAEHAPTYLLLDSAHRIARVGDGIERYGLCGLRLGEPAGTQVWFLEGLLPPPDLPFTLPAVEMPSGRVADVLLHGDGDGLWVVLLDVTTETERARLVQQKAYDLTLLSERVARLIARLERAHVELQRTHHELEQSREALLRTNRRLELELRDVEHYVRSTLPAPFSQPFLADWRFVPTTELGGDAFGYHWVDAQHFAFFLLDVCGHGVGAALLSVAVANTLRSEALPGTDFRAPGDVLTALNRAYQMDDHGDLFLTIWYGVYDRSAARLAYATAGHPPPILIPGTRGRPGPAELLPGQGPSLGLGASTVYRAQERALPAPSRLFLFSDGAFEIGRPDGSMLAFDDFVALLAQPVTGDESELDRLLDTVRAEHGPGPLEDDFSIVKLELS